MIKNRTPTDDVASRLSADELSRLATYVRLPDFEQLAIQLTGLTLERKRPEKHIKDLRAGLVHSLRLHGVAADETVDAIATALFDELWSAVVLAIGEMGRSDHPADMPGLTVGVSTPAAAAARNCCDLRCTAAVLPRADAADHPHAGTWAEQLAEALPHASAPWARERKSGVVWDMSIVNPTNSTQPGTAAFDVLVLGACLYWEVRWAIDSGSSPLPSWLRLHDRHPLNDVMTHAAAQRYDLYACDKPPSAWLSAATQDIVDRWAAREINLVLHTDVVGAP